MIARSEALAERNQLNKMQLWETLARCSAASALLTKMGYSGLIKFNSCGEVTLLYLSPQLQIMDLNLAQERLLLVTSVISSVCHIKIVRLRMALNSKLPSNQLSVLERLLL